MQLTAKQEQGLKIAVERYKNNEKYTVIGGFAGAGKSTLVKFIVAALQSCGVDPETDVGYATFTGKAAQVLIDKGNYGAMTLHKLLFKARPTPDGKFIYFPKPLAEWEHKIIIVDECSMAPKTLVERLLNYPCHVIFCGDPGQLPPVSQDDDNHLLDNPHIFLDEVMRQAQESGIIRLSMMIRNGESIDGFISDDAKVLPKSELVTGMLEWGDIVLCATNATRVSLNNQIRHIQGRTSYIEENEKLINLKNSWNTISANGNALTNGCIGTLTNIFEQSFKFPAYLKVPNNKIDVISGNFITETGDNFGIIDIDKNFLITGNQTLNPRVRYNVARNKKYGCLLPFEFTYGNVITAHKAQGSEWSNVVVVEESFPRVQEEHKRWLYTACTRSSSKLLLVR